MEGNGLKFSVSANFEVADIYYYFFNVQQNWLMSVCLCEELPEIKFCVFSLAWERQKSLQKRS